MIATGTSSGTGNMGRAKLGAGRWLASLEDAGHLHAENAAPALEAAEAAGLAAALDEIPSPAFVIWADGSIAVANDSGRAASAWAPELVASQLLASLGGRDESFRVTRIASPGAPSHFLAVQRRGAVDPAERVATAASTWGLTPRQEEVLALLVLGRSNKAMADALGCASSTVEIHVTALLSRSDCESRCELVSRFWSEPIAQHRRRGHAAGQERRLQASAPRTARLAAQEIASQPFAGPRLVPTGVEDWT
jgi:DNA-binding CsgD family transcriptional regulator